MPDPENKPLNSDRKSKADLDESERDTLEQVPPWQGTLTPDVTTSPHPGQSPSRY